MSTRVQSEVLTFLIADVRGYTSFTRTHGDEAAAGLAVTFAEIAREGIEAHAGEVLQLNGDEAVAVFRSAREALRAAIDLQLVFADETRLRPSIPLNVGIGLDTGEAVPVGGAYHGGPLNLAARLCSSAAAGEVLASQGVAHAAHVSKDMRLVEHGPLVLKGFDKPVPALRVTPASTAESPVPERAMRSDLPAALDCVTPLVGREHLVRQLRWRWRLARRGRSSVVAVVGPSGIGKTRLAAEIAALAAADGARIAYTSFAHESDDADDDRPSYLVLDDLDMASPEQLALALERAAGTSTLTLLGYDDGSASTELAAAVRRIVPAEDFVRPGALDGDAVRRIAALYVGAAADSVPADVLSAGQGVPRLVHEQIARWVHAESVRRLGRAAAETGAGREGLRALESTLAGEVVELQVARETVLLYASSSHDRSTSGPYNGLESFGLHDGDRFFGREQLVADMVARFTGAPLLAVVGASGSGKSSAICAGLLPALASGALPTKSHWTIALARPGEHPLRELDRALWSSLPHEVTARMAGADQPLSAARRALGPGDGLIVALDQFEEVFTLCRDGAERRAFIAALVDAATGTERNEIVVVGLRADYYGRCAIDPKFAELVAANHILVGSMSNDEYRRAITRPALGAGVRLEPQLVDALVNDVLGEPGALPLLSSALLELWRLREGRTIRHASYTATGGVRGAVSRLAEAAYAALGDAERRIARSLLLRLAGAGETGEAVRRRVPTSDLDIASNPAIAHVLDVLAAERLVTVGEGVVEVAHEALLREWPRFAEWLDEDREGRELHAHLGQSAHEWDARGRDPGELYRGVRLSSTLDWTMVHGAELNELERRFVEASRAASERELGDQRRRNRRLRILLAGALILLAAAVVAGALALGARSNARSAATAAIADRLGAQALTARDLDTSLLLARQGVALDDNAETRGNLEAALLRSPAARRVYRPLAGELTSVDVAPDGKLLLFGNAGGAFALADAASGRVLHVVHGTAARFAADGSVIVVHGRRVEALTRSGERQPLGSLPPGTTVAAVSGTGRLIAATRGRPGGHPSSVSLVSLPSGRVTHVLYPPPGATITGVNLSDDGRVLLLQETGTSTQPTSYATWHVTPWRAGAIIRDARSFSTAGAVSPDDRSLVAGHPDGSVTVYSLSNSTHVDLHGRHGGNVTGVGFGRGGRTIVSTGGDALVLVWDARTGALRETLAGHTGRVLGPAFGPGDATAYTVGLDRVGIAWDLSGKRRLSTPFPAGPGQLLDGRPIVSFGISPDGRRLAVPASRTSVQIVGVPTGRASFSLDATPRFAAVSLAWARDAPLVAGAGPDGGAPAVWRLVPGSALVDPARTFALPDDAGAPTAIALIPDASSVAVGTADGTVYRFTVDNSSPLGPRLHAGAGVDQLAFSPDGRRLAAAAGSSGVDVWDVADGRPLYRLRDAAASAAFSPDGRLLAAGGLDGSVRLVEAANGVPAGLPLRGNAGSVLSVAFAPDGRALVTGDADGTARIFDLGSRQPVGAPLPGLANVAVGAAFTPDGTHVVSFYATGRAYSFDLRAAAWSRAACATAGRSLTRAEWSQYLPGRPYRPAC